MQQDELKKIPGVDKFLLEPSIVKLNETLDSHLVTSIVREVLSKAREEILKGGRAKNINELTKEADILVKKISGMGIKAVINATGVILHTNLGRSPLGKMLLKEIEPVLSDYSNLEFNLGTAKRGERVEHISGLIKFITGAEDAVVVNNNAAAILLVLKTFAERKEVIVSRGELIEIGGSFRLPEIMKTSDAKMIEVGTTNRTRLEDYEKAINKNTRILFKAHKSNYYINGFTEEVNLKDLSSLAKKNNVISIYDIGSGLLKKPRRLAWLDEPDVQSSIKNGADLVSFSCDKLLGGPQAGIIAGRKDLIVHLSKAPLMRALRVDKITIAMLSAILKMYLHEDKLFTDSPVFMMLNRKKDELLTLAQNLRAALESHQINSEIVESKAQCGGGSLPHLELNSYAVKLFTEKTNKKFADNLFKKLLEAEKPVLGILREGEILFDVFTLQNFEIDIIVQSVKSCLNKS